MFQHILVPLDGSALAECVLPHVVALATPFAARVTLLHILEPFENPMTTHPVNPVDWTIGRSRVTAYLEGIAGRLAQHGVQATAEILEGQAEQRIVEFSRARQVDLLVLSSHGQSGLSNWNVSSVVQKVLMRAFRPILIVRARTPSPADGDALRYRKLLVPLDCSSRAEYVLPVASALATHYGASLLLAYVLRPPEILCTAATQESRDLVDRVVESTRTAAHNYLQDVKSRLPLRAETRVLLGDNPAYALDELALRDDVDLVMASAHGRSGAANRAYGSIALDLILYGTLPILLLQDLIPSEQELTPSEVAPRAPEERG